MKRVISSESFGISFDVFQSTSTVALLFFKINTIVLVFRVKFFNAKMKLCIKVAKKTFNNQVNILKKFFQNSLIAYPIYSIFIDEFTVA